MNPVISAYRLPLSSSDDNILEEAGTALLQRIMKIRSTCFNDRLPLTTDEEFMEAFNAEPLVFPSSESLRQYEFKDLKDCVAGLKTLGRHVTVFDATHRNFTQKDTNKLIDLLPGPSKISIIAHF